MEHVKKIIVSILFNKKSIELGELVSDGREIYFKYYTDFISKGLEISPIKLKLNTGIHKADSIPFDGLFGVFADSLPDGWGKLLLDRSLTAKGINNQFLITRFSIKIYSYEKHCFNCWL